VAKILAERDYRSKIAVLDAAYDRQEAAYLATLSERETAEYLYLQACFRLKRTPKDMDYCGDNAVSAESMRRGVFDIAEIYAAGVRDWEHAAFLCGFMDMAVYQRRIEKMESVI
jgi:hypothetical protein